MNARERLSELGLRLDSYKPGEHRARCPECSDARKPEHRDQKCVAVKITDEGAVWHCHNCLTFSGGFGQAGRDWRHQHRETYRRPTLPAMRPLPKTERGFFAERGISQETLEAFGVFATKHWFAQTQSEQPCYAFPYAWDGVVRNVKYRDADKNWAQEKDAERTLYNADNIAEDVLIWVEGEMDALTLWDAGFKSVTTLPDGAPQNEDGNHDKRFAPLVTHQDELDRVQKIIIATDMDGPGRILMRELVRRLGKHRCWVVDFPEGCKDANDVWIAQGREALVAAIENATQVPLDGVKALGDYGDRLRALYRGELYTPVEPGWPALGEIFKIKPGGLHVVTGIPNHGKSTFTLQLATHTIASEGWKWGVYCPEHTGEEIAKKLIEQRVGKPFDAGFERMSWETAEQTLDEIRRDVFLIDADIDDADPSIEWILERARDLVYRNGINGLIIDPYNEITPGYSTQTETQWISEMLRQVKQFARRYDVAVMMVAHPRIIHSDSDVERAPTLYDIAGSAHWRNKADAGLVVYRDPERDRTQIRVGKIREQPYYGRSQETAYLRYDLAQRRFVPMGTPRYSALEG